MKKTCLFLLIIIASFGEVNAGFGVQFPVFIPNNGRLTVPVPPLSIRGFGVDFNDYVGIETGYVLYYSGGMGIKGLPFQINETATNPFLTNWIPLHLAITIPAGNLKLQLNGGVFGYANFGLSLMTDPYNRALKQEMNYTLVESDISVDNKLGWGYMAGGLISWDFGKFTVKAGAHILMGESKLNMSGGYSALDSNNNLVSSVFNYENSVLDFSGIEYIIGVEL